MRRPSLILCMVALIVLVSGCAHVVPPGLREKADRSITARALFSDPDAYKGKIVILGGMIAGTTNTDKGTYIEVVQKPLDSRERPEDTDVSYGRFLILYEGYLDPAIYAKGKSVTVAGEVLGKMVRRLDEIQYPYPLLRSIQLYLIEPGRPLPIWFGVGVGAVF